MAQFKDQSQEFQSTPSAWRVTCAEPAQVCQGAISIHTLRVEGDRGLLILQPPSQISIHTLRVEGDNRQVHLVIPIVISIHTLRVEGDYPPSARRAPG